MDALRQEENLDDLEKKYLDILVYNIKLNEAELVSKFGSRLSELRASLDLRRIAADKKIENKINKQKFNDFREEEILKRYPAAMRILDEMIEHEKFYYRVEALKLIASGSFQKLISRAKAEGDAEGSGGEKEKPIYELNVNKLGSKSN